MHCGGRTDAREVNVNTNPDYDLCRCGHWRDEHLPRRDGSIGQCLGFVGTPESDAAGDIISCGCPEFAVAPDEESET